ncbi:MAG: O-antigen ligase family protein [Clostridium sulfidigenes]|jgi:O-antigen ligase|uniref:O-antigen ligase family protein n=1 Tax=Clostridium sulfidigenes TaxID=318464 RepID=A0A927ZSI7_9CLOT|nr:O-antigen ligase family protein [Clostridium sulfidigenes]
MTMRKNKDTHINNKKHSAEIKRKNDIPTSSDRISLSGQTSSNGNILYLIPILFIVTILPLIVKFHGYDTRLSGFSWFASYDQNVDFFLYYKHWIFVSLAFIMALVVIIKSYLNRSFLNFLPIFVPLAVYALLAVLSSIFSEYRSFSVTGIMEQFESIFALLGYCLVVYYIFLFVDTEKDIKIIITSLIIGVLILSTLGLSQYLGHDLLAASFGFTTKVEKNRVYLTLLNPNYVGVYVSLVLPVLIILASFNRKIWKLPIYILAISGMIICLVGSSSTAGVIAIIAALLFALIINLRHLLKYFYISVPVLCLVIGILITFNNKSDDYLTKQVMKLTNIQKSEANLTNIQTLDDEIVITYKNNPLHIRFFVYEDGSYFFDLVDSENNPVMANYEVMDEEPLTILDDRFNGFVLTPTVYNGNYAFIIKIDGHEWAFTNQTEDNSYYYINYYGKLDKIYTAPSALFTGYERYASGRGYIWSRTIPLLSKNILLGTGADTFALEFPQQDYVNLYNYGYGDSQLITKPHSLYLQIGVQTGVLSLIAFLVFYLMYFLSSCKLYIKNDYNTYYSKVGFAIFIGTLSYMIASISNDSMITVAPVFWVLIGLGITINHIEKKITAKSKSSDICNNNN